MVKRQWILIGIAAGGGLLLGGGLAAGMAGDDGFSVCDVLSLLLFSPVYGVGLVYSLGMMFRLIGGLLEKLGMAFLYRFSFSSGCGLGGCADWLFRVLIILFLFGFIISVIWIAGLFSAAKRLYDAEMTDRQIMSI